MQCITPEFGMPLAGHILLFLTLESSGPTQDSAKPGSELCWESERLVLAQSRKKKTKIQTEQKILAILPFSYFTLCTPVCRQSWARRGGGSESGRQCKTAGSNLPFHSVRLQLQEGRHSVAVFCLLLLWHHCGSGQHLTEVGGFWPEG